MGSKKIERAVFDRNVPVPAIFFIGAPGGPIPLRKEKSVEPLCSKAIIDEYLRVPAYPKFKLTDTGIDRLLTVAILPWFHPVTLQEGSPYIKNDPPDDIFTGCAAAGKADEVISGDNYLLKIKNPLVPVLSVTGFLE